MTFDTFFKGCPLNGHYLLRLCGQHIFVNRVASSAGHEMLKHNMFGQTLFRMVPTCPRWVDEGMVYICLWMDGFVICGSTLHSWPQGLDLVVVRHIVCQTSFGYGSNHVHSGNQKIPLGQSRMVWNAIFNMLI